MTSSSFLTITTIASAALIAFGAQKVLKNMDSKVSYLDSLRKSKLNSSDRAYPEDYYPGGEYAKLRYGDTRYFLFGPKEDLYSRGYSVGPLVDHDPRLYVDQLHDLLNHIKWEKCNFVGYSLNIESMLNEFGDNIPKSIEEAVKIMELQFEHHAGYARGLMSTLKSFPLTGLHQQFASFQQESYPIQVIWGTRDTVIPESTVTTLQRLVPRVKTTIVDGATHSIPLTHDSSIIEKLDGFFS
ncbi:hypothetical protein BGZ76_003352 [Entomortierella beljakovae]|nr:hypothetical protein BGZ76_003352 [Entomortierella beljakovae]